MRNQAYFLLPAAAVTLSILSPGLCAQTLFSENFDTDTSALWTVNSAAVNSTGNNAVFAFDYSTVGIPAAPGSAGTTRGLRLEANVSGGAQTGLSVSPTGLILPSDYVLRFNLWQNFNGPAPGGGNGSTQVSGAGVGTAGTTAQWAGGPTYDSVFFGATGDGGSSIDYRVYPAANTAVPASGYYAAGTSLTPDSRNNADAYYAGFGNQTPPAAQTALFPQQTGATAAGAQGFQWHDVVITKNGGTVTWDIDGVRIATVPTSGLTLGGNNILLNQYDINNTSSTDVNATALLFGLFDNVTVTAVPEPSTFALLGAAGVIFGVARRRKAGVSNSNPSY
jgi:hypothetical protein